MQKKVSLEELRKLSGAEKARLAEEIEKRAARNEIDHWGCSQATLAALQDGLDIGDRTAFKAATAFSGGIASNHEACGALIGGVMAIGLASGREKYEPGKTGLEQPELVECSARARQFCDRFRQGLGSLRCGDIRAKMGFAPNAKTSQLTPEAFRAHDRCGEVAGTAARLAAEAILEPPEKYAEAVKTFLEMMARLRREM